MKRWLPFPLVSVLLLLFWLLMGFGAQWNGKPG